MAKQWDKNRSVQPGTLLLESKINKKPKKCAGCGSNTKRCKTVADMANCDNNKKNDQTRTDNNVQG